jgi:hypothetical protein
LDHRLWKSDVHVLSEVEKCFENVNKEGLVKKTLGISKSYFNMLIGLELVKKSTYVDTPWWRSGVATKKRIPSELSTKIYRNLEKQSYANTPDLGYAPVSLNKIKGSSYSVSSTKTDEWTLTVYVVYVRFDSYRRAWKATEHCQHNLFMYVKQYLKLSL